MTLLDNFLTVLQNQYEAAFSTINRCLKSCPDEHWHQPVVNLSFSQATFHALFFADLYLHNANDDSFKMQAFHLDNQESFGDYEELEDKVQENIYEKQFIVAYLDHCRKKLSAEFNNASEEWLLQPSPFHWIQSTRSEVHIYNIRHIQHHAAQLILSLRKIGVTDLPWFKSGWEDS